MSAKALAWLNSIEPEGTGFVEARREDLVAIRVELDKERTNTRRLRHFLESLEVKVTSLLTGGV